MIPVVLHMLLCWIGFSLAVVRLRIVAQPHPTLICSLRWWAWVIAHALWVCGFASGLWASWFSDPAPTLGGWLIRSGLVIYLVLKIRSQPEPTG